MAGDTAALRPLAAIALLLRRRWWRRSYLERWARGVRTWTPFFDVAARPPRTSAAAGAARLLARQADAGDAVSGRACAFSRSMPQGLEFPDRHLDAGAWPSSHVEPVLVEPATGGCTDGGEGFGRPCGAAPQRERARLLYGRQSRARRPVVTIAGAGRPHWPSPQAALHGCRRWRALQPPVHRPDRPRGGRGSAPPEARSLRDRMAGRFRLDEPQPLAWATRTARRLLASRSGAGARPRAGAVAARWCTTPSVRTGTGRQEAPDADVAGGPLPLQRRAT